MSFATMTSEPGAQLAPDDFPTDAAWMKYSSALEMTQQLLAAEHAKALADGTHAAERESLNRYLQAN